MHGQQNFTKREMLLQCPPHPATFRILRQNNPLHFWFPTITLYVYLFSVCPTRSVCFTISTYFHLGTPVLQIINFPVCGIHQYPLTQRFSNFFQVGTTFISQNVLRTTLLLSPLKANCLRFSTMVCDTQFTLILFFLSFFGSGFQSKRTTRAEPEDHLWSADHSLRNAGVEE
jgi:hypothetical protein